MEILYLVTAWLLLTHPEASAEAASVACGAMKNVVIRSLFPVMVLSRLIAHSRLSERLCKKISATRLWQGLRLSDALLPAVLSGLLSGLPVTALETKKLLSEKRVTIAEASKAVALSSLPSPAFVILVASPSLVTGLLRYIILVITAYVTASCFRSAKSLGKEKTDTLTFSEAIVSSTSSALSVSANIVFFSALTCCISAVLPRVAGVTAVFFEMGTAVGTVGNNPIMMSAVIGWCGLSALSQIKSASPSLRLVPYAVTRGVSCIMMIVLQILTDFLQNIL